MVPAIVWVLVGVLAFSHVAPFAFFFDAAAGKLCVWRVSSPQKNKVVYLTFDDGPNLSATPQLLDLLKEKKVRATFFLIDSHVDAGTAPVVRRMFEEGHTVGLHSADRWLMTRAPEVIGRRLRAAADRIELHSGYRPAALFRPHAGWRSVSMLAGLSRLRFKLIGWSWMTWDWCWFRKRTGKRVASQVIAHAAPGKIIVIHDGHHKRRQADRLYAVQAARLIIDGLRSRGLEFATLSDPPQIPARNGFWNGCPSRTRIIGRHGWERKRRTLVRWQRFADSRPGRRRRGFEDPKARSSSRACAGR